MEWHISRIEVEITTNMLRKSDWYVNHTVDPYVVSRSGSQYFAAGVIIPDGSGGATQFSVLTEEQVLQATKEAMGQNQVDIVEALVLADMDLLLNPITVGGAPWQPPPPI